MSIKKILVATDLSELGQNVLHESKGLARALDAELLVVHVLDATPYILSGDVGYSSAAMLQSHTAAVEASLARIESGLQAEGISGVVKMEYGIPHERIVELAQSERVQLIAMGTHGRGGVRHMIMGSVAERVARTARVPVLTFRTAA